MGNMSNLGLDNWTYYIGLSIYTSAYSCYDVTAKDTLGHNSDIPGEKTPKCWKGSPFDNWDITVLIYLELIELMLV